MPDTVQKKPELEVLLVYGASKWRHVHIIGIQANYKVLISSNLFLKYQ